ncbi:related to AAH1-adenosine deaminase [Phialocephala subalpina]|uniref:Related to AAH1-adenosine deaminase n=1 Tax=Phialocephala subalpina TaxID=576137 RepID=A0A1L7X106_9HELO|nr:related to AAH1-adenosine deaminase [Phialocephala subalpina]
MSSSMKSTYEQRQKWRTQHLQSADPIITQIPKIELHVHIEGTMSPSLRWTLSQRNSIPLTCGTSKVPLTSLQEVEEAYTQIRGRIGAGSAEASKSFTFFEIYYGGFELLQTEEDFYDLAMGYFERVEGMDVRYCEVFFDPQGHTRRGIALDVVMKGFKRAQEKAAKELNVKSQWIMCFLRDMSPESAIQQYEAALPYKDMIIGIGLDSDELDRPPSLFYEVFQRAKKDKFRLTAHCDFNQKNTLEHIRQVCENLGGSGAERIDHGMNAADSDDLTEIIKKKGIGMTICPCAYIRHAAEDEVFLRIRKLFDAGNKITIASDDPAYMEDNWVMHGLYMVRDKCKFTDAEMVKLQRNAVEICWARDEDKARLSKELDEFEEAYISR